MEFTRRTDTSLGYEDAVAAVKAALQEQGFGTLTEIDVRQTLKNKIGVETSAQLIIGACNPQLAHKALGVDPRIAALLPCNVVVRVEGERTIIEALDPTIMATVSGTPGLEEIAEDAGRRIQTALDTVHAR